MLADLLALLALRFVIGVLWLGTLEGVSTMFFPLLLESESEGGSFAGGDGPVDSHGVEESDGGLVSDEAARTPSGRPERDRVAQVNDSRSVRKAFLGQATWICLGGAIFAATLNKDSMRIVRA